MDTFFPLDSCARLWLGPDSSNRSSRSSPSSTRTAHGRASGGHGGGENTADSRGGGGDSAGGGSDSRGREGGGGGGGGGERRGTRRGSCPWGVGGGEICVDCSCCCRSGCPPLGRGRGACQYAVDIHVHHAAALCVDSAAALVTVATLCEYTGAALVDVITLFVAAALALALASAASLSVGTAAAAPASAAGLSVDIADFLYTTALNAPEFIDTVAPVGAGPLFASTTFGDGALFVGHHGVAGTVVVGPVSEHDELSSCSRVAAAATVCAEVDPCVVAAAATAAGSSCAVAAAAAAGV